MVFFSRQNSVSINIISTARVGSTLKCESSILVFFFSSPYHSIRTQRTIYYIEHEFHLTRKKNVSDVNCLKRRYIHYWCTDVKIEINKKKYHFVSKMHMHICFLYGYLKFIVPAIQHGFLYTFKNHLHDTNTFFRFAYYTY